MKVLVCGSRDWDDFDAVANRMVELPADRLDFGSVTIVHGDANGADSIARRVGRMFGFTTSGHRADWKHYGKRAGILRNLAMLDERPDLVIAFQRNGSRGTQHTIDEARKRGIPVEVHTSD